MSLPFSLVDDRLPPYIQNSQQKKTPLNSNDHTSSLNNEHSSLNNPAHSESAFIKLDTSRHISSQILSTVYFFQNNQQRDNMLRDEASHLVPRIGNSEPNRLNFDTLDPNQQSSVLRSDNFLQNNQRMESMFRPRDVFPPFVPRSRSRPRSGR